MGWGRSTHGPELPLAKRMAEKIPSADDIGTLFGWVVPMGWATSRSATARCRMMHRLRSSATAPSALAVLLSDDQAAPLCFRAVRESPHGEREPRLVAG